MVYKYNIMQNNPQNDFLNQTAILFPYLKKRIPNDSYVTKTETPHQTQINNIKITKYFSSKSNTKSALQNYITQTKIPPPHHKKTNSITLSKDIIKSTELHSTPKKSFKLKQKFEDESFDSDSDNDDDFLENKPIKFQKSVRSTYSGTDNRKHFNNINNDSFISKENKKERLNTTDIEQIEIKISKDFNFEHLNAMENYLNELTEDIEINKMKIFQNLLDIIEDLLKCYNNKTLYENMFKVFDTPLDLKKHSIQKICKDFHIQLLIFLYLILILNFVKTEKSAFLSGIKNLSFYLHQNFIIFMFIIITQHNLTNKTNVNESEDNNDLKQCEQKISNNKTWLSKSNFKQYFISNNKKCKSTLKNIINEIRSHFQSLGNGIKIETTNKTIELETTLNLFMAYLKTLHKTKLESVIDTLQSSIEINSLFKISKNKNYNPFLQDKSPSCKLEYTLVLDLDETLVHFVQGENDSNNIVQIRPGAEQFIEDLSEYFEIIIFTAAKQDYADLVIDGVDLNHKVSGRLYRDHTIKLGDGYIKDLSKLGRDLKKMLIVDNCADNFSLQPKNGLKIKDFEGDPEDNELEFLKEDLIEMIQKKPKDVRDCLEEIQKKMDRREEWNDDYNDYTDEETNENQITTKDNNYEKEYCKKEESKEHEQETNDHEENIKESSDDEECKIDISS